MAGLVVSANTEDSCCVPGKGTGEVVTAAPGGLPWGFVPLPAACLPAPLVPLVWDKALCVLHEGAHGWLEDEAAFAGLRS